MSVWTSKVEAPFRDDAQFWLSVGRSADAFWSLLAATVLVVAVGAYALVAFVVPVALVVAGTRHARASTARNRLLFASREEWLGAERRAVAAAIPGALVRYVHPHRMPTG